MSTSATQQKTGIIVESSGIIAKPPITAAKQPVTAAKSPVPAVKPSGAIAKQAGAAAKPPITAAKPFGAVAKQAGAAAKPPITTAKPSVTAAKQQPASVAKQPATATKQIGAVVKQAGTAVVDSDMAQRLGIVLRDIHPEYLLLIDRNELANILTAVGSKNVTPSDEYIMEWLRYAGPRDVKGIICGQDPYPKGGMGLAFSVMYESRGKKFPATFRNIAACLAANGHAPPLQHADLRPWAAQGILLPNMALTTIEGASGKHLKLWKSFVSALLNKIAAIDRPRKPFFILWGGKAQDSLASVAKRHGCRILEWSHPSPTGDNSLSPDKRFINCTNFAEAEALAGKIVWDPSASILIFTDGACRGNGASHAAAGSGVVIVGGHFSKTHLSISVAPHNYIFVDPNDPTQGFRPDINGKQVRPSNNRGELLAICWGLFMALVGHAFGNVDILSDSDISIRTLNEWLPKRRLNDSIEAQKKAKMVPQLSATPTVAELNGVKPKKTKRADELCNYDLLLIAEKLLTCVRQKSAKCTLSYVPAAHDSKLSETATLRERLIWTGNDIADTLAKRGKDPVPPLIESPHEQLRRKCLALLYPAQ